MTAPAAVSNASTEEIIERFARAREAQAVWSRYTLTERVRRLRALWSEIRKSRAALIRLIQEETGKPAAEIEIMELCAAEFNLRYFTGNAHRILKDRAVPRPWLFFNKRAYVRYLPRGVAGLITPWHMPFLVPFGDALPALLAGNAVVLKPSEWGTRTALWLEEIMKVSGLFPEALLQVATGDFSTGIAVAKEADIVLFTGSSPGGREMAQAAAERLKPAILELGGKHPMIVLKDALLDRAAKAAVWGRFANSGQQLVGVERVYVEEDVYPAFCEAVRRETRALRQRQDSGYGTDLGRLVHPRQMEIVLSQLQNAKELGAQVEGGEVVDAERLIVSPALVFDAKPEMKVLREETFGPVLPLIPVISAEEALSFANHSPFGLAGSIWSRDIPRAEALSVYLESGLVGINDLPNGQYIVCSLPFGGLKESGLGHRHSEEGLRIFCHSQSVLVHEWPLNLPELWWFPYSRFKTRLLSFLSRWV